MVTGCSPFSELVVIATERCRHFFGNVLFIWLSGHVMVCHALHTTSPWCLSELCTLVADVASPRHL